MDLETYNLEGVLIPYAISYFDGKVSKSFYINDYKDKNEMLRECIKSLMRRRYHNYKIYIHNFSNFDVIFLFNTIIELADSVDPIINDGQFINIIFNFGDYKLYFRDSYLLLPSSLR